MTNSSRFLSLSTGPQSDTLADRFLAKEHTPIATFTPRGVGVEAWVRLTPKTLVIFAQRVDAPELMATVRMSNMNVDRNRLARNIERAVFKVLRSL